MRMRSKISVTRHLMAFTLLGSPVAWSAEPPLGALIQDLTGPDARARAVARQLLPRQGVEAVAELIPLLSSADPVVAKASFDVVMDIANEACTPGREADRQRVTDHLIALAQPDRPEAERIIGLRLLERLVPEGYDLKPIAAMLKEESLLRDKARTALQRIGTTQARQALRSALNEADPAFQCAILNALAELEDTGSLEVSRKLTGSDDAHVRAAAARALAWTGDPAYLKVIKAVMISADEATRFEATDALVRLANAIETRGGNWQIAVNTYLDMLPERQGVFMDAALAGLGRIGDGTCVQAILTAIKDADIRTWLNGIDALRKMQGVDVARALVAAYPNLPPETQLALLPVLGGKRHAIVLPTLEQAARSTDPASRVAALQALGETGLFDAVGVLVSAAGSGPDEERTAARCGLMAAADALRAKGNSKEAGAVYLRAYEAGPDKDDRRRALEGLAACPVVEACGAAKAATADEDLREPAVNALTAVAGTLAAAGRKREALDAYETVRRLTPSAEALRPVVEAMRKLGADIDTASALGIVTNWWVIGPFDLGEQNAGWNTDFIGEPNVKLDASCTSGDRRVAWKHVVTTDEAGKVDLRAGVADRDQCIAYAYAEITVDQETEAVLRVGVDDSERIWLNGQKVFELFVGRALQIDQDRVPVKLQKGINRLLLKIWQNNLAWQFCLRITTPDGRCVAFTQKTE